MNFDRKVASLGLLLTLGVLAAGFSGINTGGSVSPATFLIPGLGRVEPLPTSPVGPGCPPPAVLTLARAD